MSAAKVAALSVALVVPSGRAAFRMRSTTMFGRTYVFLRDVATYYGMSYQAGTDAAHLRSRWSRLRFAVDRRESTLNGVNVHLCFAPGRRNGEILVARTDFEALLNPILRSRDLPPASVRRIVIDPGHGGRDQGAAGARHVEKDLVLAISQRLAAYLSHRGYEARLTRDSDESLSLSARMTRVGRLRPDVLVSVHTNSVGTGTVSGIETFVVNPLGTPSTYGNRTSSTVHPGNAYDPLNAKLAYEVQRALVRGTSCVDRGVRHARFLVLREAPCPAILVETGFISNVREERRLASPSYQGRLAAGICNGIMRFHQSLLDR